MLHEHFWFSHNFLQSNPENVGENFRQSEYNQYAVDAEHQIKFVLLYYYIHYA